MATKMCKFSKTRNIIMAASISGFSVIIIVFETLWQTTPHDHAFGEGFINKPNYLLEFVLCVSANPPVPPLQQTHNHKVGLFVFFFGHNDEHWLNNMLLWYYPDG